MAVCEVKVKAGPDPWLDLGTYSRTKPKFSSSMRSCSEVEMILSERKRAVVVIAALILAGI
jgi:hypothetical protein